MSNGKRRIIDKANRALTWLTLPGNTWILLAIILILAASFRYYHVNWDEGQHIHPDERFLTMVENSLSWPKSLKIYFDSTKSPLNPYNHNFGLFVYGTLPIFIVKWLGIKLHMLGYGRIYLLGRELSATMDLLSILLLYFVGRRLYSRKVGLLASALYAFAVMAIQQSHFFTVDNFGTFFALLTFYLAVRIAQDGRWVDYLFIGVTYGATVACRINLAAEVGVILLAVLVAVWRDWQNVRHPLERRILVENYALKLVVMSLLAFVAFRTFQPYAFGGHSFLDVRLSKKWLENMKYIRKLIGGDIDYPPGHQWANRTPFLFPWRNMVIWGMGLAMGLTVWIGWLVALYRLLYRKELEHLLPVAWAGGMFLYQGLQFVQSMRYLLPLYPILILLGSWFLFWLVDQARRWSIWDGSAVARRAPALAKGLMALVLIFTFLWALAFMRIYRHPLTRITASRWMFAHIPRGAVIANEHWDDPLPLRVDGKDPFGMMYKGIMMTNYDEDTPQKREKMIANLDRADVLVLSSNRLYGSIPRLPMRYPMTTKYYKALFAGKLGFHLAAEFTSFPGLLGLEFDDQSAEEAFSVYDHPVVHIFLKDADYSEAKVRSILDSVDLSHVYRMIPKQVSAAPDALLLSKARIAEQEAGGTWSAMFHPGDLVNRVPVLVWLLLVELLGLAGFAIMQPLVHLPDGGYGLSKTLGWLLFGYLVWLGASVGLFPATRLALWLVFLILLLAAAAMAWRRRDALQEFVHSRFGLLALEEAIFLAFFLFFLWVRWHNPDLWHPARGGEKPMDFAYLNAVIKSVHFPPYDPWFAGGYINYYYFGFVLVGMLTKLSGIVPAVAYNLALPTLYGFLALGSFSVAASLLPTREATSHEEQVGRFFSLRLCVSASKYFPALAAPIFVAVAGNLVNFSLAWKGWLRISRLQGIHSVVPGLAKLAQVLSGIWVWAHGGNLGYPNDWWFWNASRVIKDTINEFPYFSFLYADLHAHVMALPLTVLALGMAAALFLGAKKATWRQAAGTFVLLALAVGSLKATNTWDYPTYLLLGVGGWLLYVKQRRGLDFYGWLDVVWGAVGLSVLSTLFFLPYSRHYATAYVGIQRWKGPFTHLDDYLMVWGAFLALLVLVLAAEWMRQEREGNLPGWVAENGMPLLTASGLVAIAAALVGLQSWIVSLPMLTAVLVLLWDRNLPARKLFILFMLGWGLALTMGVEIVRLKDDIGRMNTVFKFYLQVWVLWGVALAASLPDLWAEMKRWSSTARWVSSAVAALLLAAALFYPVTATPAKMRDRFSSKTPHSLNGELFMLDASYAENGRSMRLDHDYYAIQWIRGHVPGTPVVLEGRAPLYHWGSRIAIYTGLPDPLGWDWHEKQQRSVIPSPVIDQRAREVQEMYATGDMERFLKLACYYRVRYVVVGDLERAMYPAQGLAKFDAHPEIFRKVYDRSGTQIYRLSPDVTGEGGGVSIPPAPTPTPTKAPAKKLPAPSPMKSP